MCFDELRGQTLRIGFSEGEELVYSFGWRKLFELAGRDLPGLCRDRHIPTFATEFLEPPLFTRDDWNSYVMSMIRTT